MTAAAAAKPVLPRGKHQILTPEGVQLVFDLADAGERLSAFLIDGFFIMLAIVAVIVVFMFSAFGVSGISGGWLIAGLIVVLFIIRTFYFTFFELHWRGQTPGKRALKLRVIDRAGGPLRSDAVLVRNFMREVEVFLPLSALFAGQGSTGDDSWMTLCILAWSGLFAIFPLFNRDRLRLGDLVAGTCVVRAPRAALLQDLSARASVRRRGTSTDIAVERYRFSQQQLDVYGVLELQALEEILRRRDINSNATKIEVARRIRQRIVWEDTAGTDAQSFDATAFLDAFYAAQRGRLERELLFGVRRRDKHDRSRASNRHDRKPGGPAR